MRINYNKLVTRSEVFGSSSGFTLVEILVVIGIILILIGLLAVASGPVQVKVKEAQVKAHCKTIEDGLAAYAANHDGLYPGFAIDINAPWPNYLMGDSTADSFKCPSQPYPEVYLKPADNWPYRRAHPDMLVGEAVTGGDGHQNSMDAPYGLRGKSVQEQIAYAKKAEGDLKRSVDRRFDALVLDGCISEYPMNPFRKSNFKFYQDSIESNRMINVFRLYIQMGHVFDYLKTQGYDDGFIFYRNEFMAGDFAVKVPATVIDTAPNPGAYPAETGPHVSGEFAPCYGYYRLWWADQNHSEAFWTDAKWFGIQKLPELEGVGPSYPNVEYRPWFAEGDFAYVPIFSESTTPFRDDPYTQPCELFMFGSGVPGYLLFGYGSQKSRVQHFRNEQIEFGRIGLPGFGSDTGGTMIPGAPAIDTQYEFAVYNLFNGAVYYRRLGA